MKELNKFTLISFGLGIAYSFYLVLYFFGAIGGQSAEEQIGGAIATVIVMPHMIVTILAMIFNGLGCFLNKQGFVLTGAILYIVAMLLMPVYFMFTILQGILSMIGYVRMRKGMMG